MASPHATHHPPRDAGDHPRSAARPRAAIVRGPAFILAQQTRISHHSPPAIVSPAWCHLHAVVAAARGRGGPPSACASVPGREGPRFLRAPAAARSARAIPRRRPAAAGVARGVPRRVRRRAALRRARAATAARWSARSIEDRRRPPVPLPPTRRCGARSAKLKPPKLMRERPGGGRSAARSAARSAGPSALRSRRRRASADRACLPAARFRGRRATPACWAYSEGGRSAEPQTPPPPPRCPARARRRTSSSSSAWRSSFCQSWIAMSIAYRGAERGHHAAHTPEAL